MLRTQLQEMCLLRCICWWQWAGLVNGFYRGRYKCYQDTATAAFDSGAGLDEPWAVRGTPPACCPGNISRVTLRPAHLAGRLQFVHRQVELGVAARLPRRCAPDLPAANRRRGVHIEKTAGQVQAGTNVDGLDGVVIAVQWRMASDTKVGARSNARNGRDNEIEAHERWFLQ